MCVCVASEEILTHFAHQLQSATSASAVESVSRFTDKPALVAEINADFVFGQNMSSCAVCKCGGRIALE